MTDSERSALQNAIMSMSAKKSDFADFEDRLHTSIDGIIDIAAKSKPIRDAYGNSISSIGTDDMVKSFSTYGFDNSTLNYPLWLALYNDSWVFRRAIDKPAQDEVNCGIVLHGKEDFSKVYKDVQKYRSELIQILSWGALFGGSVGVMMFDGVPDEDLQKPLNYSEIRNRQMQIYVTDRWYGVQPSTELVDNMKSIDFGKPKYYTISFADGGLFKVHHSRVLRYEHRWAPKLIKCGQLQGWGYAEGSHILNELSRDDQLKASITSLVNKSLIEVVKMAGMRGVFMGTDKDNQEQLTKRLEMVNWARTYNSLTFLDKDDEYDQKEFNGATGLAQLLETNMWLVAAALEMQGVLFGDLKGGLSQESDAFHRYAVTIKNRCETYYRPVLYKFLKVLFAINGIEGTNPDFDFLDLDLLEQNEKRVAGLSSYVSLLNQLIDQGTISRYQSAIAMRDYMNRGVITIGFDDDYLDKLKLEEGIEIVKAYQTSKIEPPTSLMERRFGGTGLAPQPITTEESTIEEQIDETETGQ